MQIEVYGVTCTLSMSEVDGSRVGKSKIYRVKLQGAVTINGVRITEANGFGYVSYAKSAASLKVALCAAINKGETVLHSYALAIVG